MTGFDELLAKKAKEAEDIVLSYMPAAEGRQKTVYEAMRYSLESGGKRLRPVLMLETFRLYGGDEKKVHPFMAALEMIHTYSLIHDDLPAMDDDELRRGRPTCHVAYGEAMAVLAGDGLLNTAFETAFEAALEAAKNGDKNAAMAGMVLAKKAGCGGMIGGQVVDIEAEESGHVSDEDEINFIHEHKTAALLQAALMAGAITAGAPDEDIDRLERIGRYLGIAFQIRDDILDVTGDQELLGKPVGSDEKNEKATYVTLKGIEKSDEAVHALSKQAKDELALLPGDHEFLETLFDKLTERRK